MYNLIESGSIYGIGNILDNGGQLCLLYDGNSNTGPVTSVYAGLHYVVACCQGDIQYSLLLLHWLLF